MSTPAVNWVPMDEESPVQTQPKTSAVVNWVPMDDVPTEATTVDTPNITDDDFISRVNARVKKRELELVDTFESYLDKGEIGGFQLATQVIGKGAAGTILDVLGETLSEGASYIPSAIKDPIVDGIKATANFLSDTDAGKAALDALQEGQEAWDGFKTTNPQEAKTIESVFNIAALVTPAKKTGSTGISPLKPLATAVDELGIRQAVQDKR